MSQPQFSSSIFVVWSDLNRDGIPQADEVQFHVTPGRRYAKPAVMADLSVIATSGLYIPPPVAFTDDGVPVWDMEQAQVASGDHHTVSGDILRTTDETVIFTMDGFQGPRVVRAFREGEPVWHINGWGGPGRVDPIAEHPGQLINAQRNIGFPFTPTEGEGGEMFILNGWHGSLYVLTSDGLIVTDLSGDYRTHPSIGPDRAYRGQRIEGMSFRNEHFWPSVTQAHDGAIHVGAGKEFSALFRLVDYDSIARIDAGTISVSQEQLGALPEVKVQPGEGRRVERRATVPMSANAPTVDGDLSDWVGADWLSIQPRFEYEGALRVDAQNLYAAWRTPDAALLANDAADGWHHAFATGGGLDLMLRTNPDSESNDAIAGDVRLFVTRVGDPRDGRVLAVLFEQAGGDGQAVDYVSPVGHVRFQSVRDVSEQVELVQRAGHYELAVPLDVLGLKPQHGMAIRGDMGVLRGDGSDTHGRFYWSNKAAHMTTDIPSEARLQPRHWGEWIFDEGH